MRAAYLGVAGVVLGGVVVVVLVEEELFFLLVIGGALAGARCGHDDSRSRCVGVGSAGEKARACLERRGA